MEAQGRERGDQRQKQRREMEAQGRERGDQRQNKVGQHEWSM